MKVKIEYKSDTSTLPYCAYTWIGKNFFNTWSSKSFADARRQLIERIKAMPVPPMPPDPEEIDI